MGNGARTTLRTLNRIFAVLFCLSITSIGVAQYRALILLDSRAAGPQIPSAIDSHPLWVMWPDREAKEVLWPAVSIATGVHWRVTESDLTIRRNERGDLELANHPLLATRGIPLEVANNLGPVKFVLERTRDETYSRRAASLAIAPASAKIPQRQTDSKLGNDEILVAEAKSWDDVARLRAWLKGPVVVLEWRESLDAGLSHLWNLPKPESPVVPVGKWSRRAGVLELREVGQFVANPGAFRSESVPSNTTAAQLGQFVSLSGFVLALVALAWIVTNGVAIHAIREELRLTPARPALEAGLLIIPSIVLSGGLAAYLGEMAALSFAPICLGLLFALLQVLKRWDALDARAIIATITAASLAWVEPNQTPFQTFFAQPFRPLSGLYIGLLLSAGIAMIRFSKGGWLPRVLVCAVFGIAILGRRWVGGEGLLWMIPVASIAVAENWVGLRALAFVSTICTGMFALEHIVTYAPLDRFFVYHDAAAINLWWVLPAAQSPVTWFFVIATVAFALYGMRFYMHQWKRLIRKPEGKIWASALIISAATACVRPEWWDLPLGVMAVAVPMAHFEMLNTTLPDVR